jgi:hypothetical protein
LVAWSCAKSPVSSRCSGRPRGEPRCGVWGNPEAEMQNRGKIHISMDYMDNMDDIDDYDYIILYIDDYYKL